MHKVYGESSMCAYLYCLKSRRQRRYQLQRQAALIRLRMIVGWTKRWRCRRRSQTLSSRTSSCCCVDESTWLTDSSQGRRHARRTAAAVANGRRYCSGRPVSWSGLLLQQRVDSTVRLWYDREQAVTITHDSYDDSGIIYHSGSQTAVTPDARSYTWDRAN